MFIGSEIQLDKPLAELGGIPLHEPEWPKWPRAGMAAQRNILEVLHGDKWTLSGRARAKKTFEQEFGERYAKFCTREYGVPCATGSAAIRISLLALNIGEGDEVLIPGMTWLGVASAVQHLGAVPIFVDTCQDSFALSVSDLKSKISKRTKAIIAAHMYSSLVDIQALEKVCEDNCIHLIEDGSQAHGARIDDRVVGSFGKISIFSFQQTKLLSGGEGGIALTDDRDTYVRLQQLRADGRVYGLPDSAGFYGLEQLNKVLGANLCMSEFHAAVLVEGLQRLSIENTHRCQNVQLFISKLQDIHGAQVVVDQELENSTFYKVPVIFDENLFTGVHPKFLAQVFSRELQFPIETLDPPLSSNVLFSNNNGGQSSSPSNLPNAEKFYNHAIAIPHPCFLGSEQDVDALVHSVARVIHHSDQIKRAFKGITTEVGSGR